MLRDGEVDDAVDPPPDPNHASDANVVNEELRRVPGGGRLLRGEQAVLAECTLEEVVPVRSARRAQTLHETQIGF